MAELHPTGFFDDAKIIDHGFDTSSEKGTLYFWVEYQTKHGRLTGYFYMSEKAIEHTLKKIAAMGFDGDDLDTLADGSKLAGNLCQITVNHEEYDGQQRARVGWVNENNAQVGPTHNDVAAANAASFNAMWRKKKKGGGNTVQANLPF